MMPITRQKKKTESERCCNCSEVFDKRTISPSIIKNNICPYCSDPEDVQDSELLTDMIYTLECKINDFHKAKDRIRKVLAREKEPKSLKRPPFRTPPPQEVKQ